MMILQTFTPNLGQPSASPFCVKAMCLLTMAGVEWKGDFKADVRKAPRKKLPVLIDGANIIPDSTAIGAYLVSKGPVGTTLSPRDAAMAHAVSRMAEEHLYFGIVYDRWVLDENWAHIKELYFSAIPGVMRGFISGMVRKGAIASLKGQGLGRMSYEDMVDRVGLDCDAIGELVGDGFVLSKTPTIADASVGPMISAAINGPEDTLFRQRIRANTALCDYAARVEAAIYPPVEKYTRPKAA